MSNQIVEQNYPDKPDITVLQQMHDPLIQVTKVLQEGTGKNRKSVNVINGGTNLDYKGILALQDQLLDTKTFPKGGPGLYEFDVTDQGSGAKNFWRVRIGVGGVGDDATPAGGGPRIPMTASGQPLGTAPPSALPRGPAAPAAFRAAVPLAAESEDLGNGLIYNSKYHMLTYPDGQVFKWTPGDPLPHTLQANAPAASPVNLGASMFGGPAAANPELNEIRAALANTQAALAQAKEEAREQQRQREQEAERARHERELAALREASDKQISELREMMKVLTAKPAEDPRVVALEAKLAEQTRDAALRAEMDRKFDALTTAMRDLSANKGPDPMVQVLTNMLGQQSTAAQETIRSIRELMGTQLGAAQAAVMTPEKLLVLIREQAEIAQNSGSSVVNEKMLGVISNLFDMVTRFNQAQGSDGAGWIDVIREAVDKVGTAATTFAQVQARKATAATAIANARAVEATAATRVAEARARHLAPVPAEPAQAASGTNTKPGVEAARVSLAEAMDRADGVGKPPATAAADSAAVPTAPTAPTKRGKKASAPAAPANPIKDASTEQLREVFGSTEDATFFGPVFEMIESLREEFNKDPNAVAPDDVADYVIQARPQLLAVLKASGGKPPLALEMLAHGKFDYLFERMLPEADEPFWGEAAKALAARMAAERASAPTG
jgi:flagellar motor protein MotB